MPKRRAVRTEGDVGLAVQHLDGTPLSPGEERSLLRLLKGPGSGSWASGAALAGVSLPAPIPASAVAFTCRGLALWALLSAGRKGMGSRCAPLAAGLVAEVWGERGAEKEKPGGGAGRGTGGGVGEVERLFSVPIVLLVAPDRQEEKVPGTGGLAWKDVYARCTSWFQGHLQRAEGRDPLANWVLTRLPPVWLFPDRTGARGEEGRTPGLSLAEQVERWLPASDEELDHRSPRRTPPPRSKGGR
ncbi:MAG: hypothetical protein KGJ23_01935 [Euryarchaeota archaeon]|nr:hypothetical protein [Euryarchaeota archaeon]MDE1835355.1 hypothetical protein [Euryarchaeota archaeon]MDE1880750.1 hypothetical protein [Euryarchaeota archaeon]MDE2043651.1 hypothetical protein [Thermoplasmata archaeon]